jgi:3-deoxy-D-manno-octulosonic-acid transferase
MDGKLNASKFLDIVKPFFTVFVKYDFWFYYMTALHKSNTPFVYISSIFRADQYFFKWYGRPFLEKLKLASQYFVQNELSQKLLSEHGIQNVSITGDTRFDRVVQLPKTEFTDERIEAFIQNNFVIIGGSTWPQDETLLIQYIQESSQKPKLILVPHEINDAAIKKTIQLSANKIVQYSQSDISKLADGDILIIDTVGMLSKIFRYGNIAFIGGGFGKGIHNTLEAAVYGLPILFGPNYFKFNEAIGLIENNGAWSVKNYNELKVRLEILIKDTNLLYKAGENNKAFVINNAGATVQIMTGIKRFF